MKHWRLAGGILLFVALAVLPLFMGQLPKGGYYMHSDNLSGVYWPVNIWRRQGNGNTTPSFNWFTCFRWP